MLIGKITKTATQEIRITINEWKEKKYIDIRVYYLADDNEFKPTQKGVSIAPDLIEEVIEHLIKAKDTYEKGEGV